MTEWTPIAATLVSSAEGESWREEAACWLLAESGPSVSHWPDRLQQAGLIAWEDQEDADWDLARIRWGALADELDDGFPKQLHGTGAEVCVLRFACSLVTGRGGEWGNDLPRLDHINRRLVLGAIAWACGGESAAAPYILDPLGEPPVKPVPTDLRIV